MGGGGIERGKQIQRTQDKEKGAKKQSRNARRLAAAAAAEVSLLHLRNSSSHSAARTAPVTLPSGSAEDFVATQRSLFVADGEDGCSPAALSALTLRVSAQSKSHKNLLLVHF